MNQGTRISIALIVGLLLMGFISQCTREAKMRHIIYDEINWFRG